MAAKAHLPIHVAAAELGMGTTMVSALVPTGVPSGMPNPTLAPAPWQLKVRRQELGLSRWPHRLVSSLPDILCFLRNRQPKASCPDLCAWERDLDELQVSKPAFGKRRLAQNLTIPCFSQASVGSEKFLVVLERSRAVLKSAQKWYHKNVHASKKLKTI
jgi:hypothetical protein